VQGGARLAVAGRGGARREAALSLIWRRGWRGAGGSKLAGKAGGQMQRGSVRVRIRARVRVRARARARARLRLRLRLRLWLRLRVGARVGARVRVRLRVWPKKALGGGMLSTWWRAAVERAAWATGLARRPPG
jgi:hypothetical protein